MRYAIVVLFTFFLVGCGQKPMNDIKGKETNIDTEITVNNHSNGVVIISPDLATKSGDVGQEADTTAEWTNTIKDLLAMAQPGSVLNTGEKQTNPTATTEVDNSQEDSNNSSTTSGTGGAPTTDVVDPVTNTDTTPIDRGVQYHHYFSNGDGTSDFEGKASFVQCPGSKWQWCRVDNQDDKQFNYHGLDGVRALWVFPAEVLINEATTMVCGNDTETVSYAIGSSLNGKDSYGSCK